MQSAVDFSAQYRILAHDCQVAKLPETCRRLIFYGRRYAGTRMCRSENMARGRRCLLGFSLGTGAVAAGWACTFNGSVCSGNGTVLDVAAYGPVLNYDIRTEMSKGKCLYFFELGPARSPMHSRPGLRGGRA